MMTGNCILSHFTFYIYTTSLFHPIYELPFQITFFLYLKKICHILLIPLTYILCRVHEQFLHFIPDFVRILSRIFCSCFMKFFIYLFSCSDLCSLFFQKTCNSFHNQCNFIIIQRMLILDHLYRIFVFPFSFFRSLSLYFKESILSFLTQTEPGEEKTEQSFFLIQVLFNFLFRPHSTL